MSSEPPPNSNETNSFPLNSPPTIRNNHLYNRVVSQSQDRSVPESRNLFSPNGQIDLLLAASRACHNVQEQTPIREVSTVAAIETPIRSSPSKAARLASVRTLLFSPNPEQKAQSVARRKRLIASNKRSSRPYGNPVDCILWFLRQDRLTVTAANLELPLNFKTHYRSLGANWHSKPSLLTHAPFNHMREVFKHGSNALSQRHSRLLLEDVLVLHPDDCVVCLISKHHPFFKRHAS